MDTFKPGKKKILIVVSKAILGGHILSAFTIAKYLQERGHSILFCGGSGSFTQVIKEEFPFVTVPIPHFHGRANTLYESRNTYFTWQSFISVRKLRQIIKKHDFDIIHAFDARAYVHSSIAALLEGKPICCTLCGGIDPHYNIPNTKKIIVFSEEQRNKLLKQYRWKPEQVDVIRTRVDIDKIINDNSSPPIDLLLENNVPSLMMISSFDGTKAPSILQVMDALELLLEEGISFQMVFVGGKGAFFEEIQERSVRINRKWDRQVVTLTGPVVDAYKLLKKATVVLGVGRSAFEGMAFAKPTIVVGANGFAGLVSERTVEDVAYYNFSGRNQNKLLSPNVLAHELKGLLEDSEKQKSIGMFGQVFVLEEIDVKKGLLRIEDVYEHCMVPHTFMFRFGQWFSVLKIMIPIWRDNWWHSFGMPMKMVGRRVVRTIKVRL